MPTKTQHSSIETITNAVGRWNTDIATGWDTGLKGKRRILGRLYDRHPPEHFLEPQNTSRYMDWLEGYTAAIRYRSIELNRTVHFVGHNTDGRVSIERKGWGVRRGSVITKMEDMGCRGTVMVYYFEGAALKRTVECGI